MRDIIKLRPGLTNEKTLTNITKENFYCEAYTDKTEINLFRISLRFVTFYACGFIMLVLRLVLFI